MAVGTEASVRVRMIMLGEGGEGWGNSKANTGESLDRREDSRGSVPYPTPACSSEYTSISADMGSSVASTADH